MDRITSEICDEAKYFHRFFAQQIWPKHPKVAHFNLDNQIITPSYHNEFHIKGVVEAAKVVSDGYTTEYDPFDIQKQLDYWNTQHKSLISPEEFQTSFIVAFACHDLGTLTQSDKTNFSNPTSSLDFSDHFQLETQISEQRSANLAMLLIQHFDQQKKFTPEMKMLIKHLIMQTVFIPSLHSSDTPFWLLMQFIDQVASYFFCDIPLYKASAGYLNELSVSNSKDRLPFSLKQFLSFLPNRLYQLTPNLEKRKRILFLLDPTNEKTNLFDYFAEIDDRPIEYIKDVEEIYKGKWNRVS